MGEGMRGDKDVGIGMSVWIFAFGYLGGDPWSAKERSLIVQNGGKGGGEFLAEA